MFRSRRRPAAARLRARAAGRFITCLWDCASRRLRSGASYLEYVARITARRPAAVITRPVHLCPTFLREYWQRIRKVCDRHGTPAIFDEICHGLGRTGRMFTCEFTIFGVTPDILQCKQGQWRDHFLPSSDHSPRESTIAWPDRALGHYTHEKARSPARRRLAAFAHMIEEQGLVRSTRPAWRARRSASRADVARRLIRRRPQTRPVDRRVELSDRSPDKARDGRGPEEIMYRAHSRAQLQTNDGQYPDATPPLIITQEEMDRRVRLWTGMTEV